MNLSKEIVNNESSEESSDEDSNVVYIHIYECNKCGYTTRNDDPDCSKCHKTVCMLAREIKIPFGNNDDGTDDDDDDHSDDKNNISNEPTICSEDCACDLHR